MPKIKTKLKDSGRTFTYAEAELKYLASIKRASENQNFLALFLLVVKSIAQSQKSWTETDIICNLKFSDIPAEWIISHYKALAAKFCSLGLWERIQGCYNEPVFTNKCIN